MPSLLKVSFRTLFSIGSESTGVEGDGNRKDEKKVREFVAAVRKAEAPEESDA